MEDTIYDRLGSANLKLLIDNFYDFVFEDERINHLFVNTPKEVIKQKQFMFLTQFLGGPDIYSQSYGHPKMRARHLPHKITENSALSWLQCMKKAVDTLPISTELKTELFNCFPQVAIHMINTQDS